MHVFTNTLLLREKKDKKRNFKRKEEKEADWNVRAQRSLTSFVLVRFQWDSGTWLGSRSGRIFTHQAPT